MSPQLFSNTYWD